MKMGSLGEIIIDYEMLSPDEFIEKYDLDRINLQM